MQPRQPRPAAPLQVPQGPVTLSPAAAANAAGNRLDAKRTQADDIGKAIATARAGGDRGAKQRVLEEAMDQAEAQDLRALIGLDIPFDVTALLTRGVVEQKGMEVGPDFFVDMHTLDGDEDILSELLIEDIFGVMKISPAYVRAKEICTLAMAITRVNNERYLVPPTDRESRGTDEFKRAWNLKIALANFIKKMGTPDRKALVLVYDNLRNMDVLVNEAARKKSI